MFHRKTTPMAECSLVTSSDIVNFGMGDNRGAVSSDNRGSSGAAHHGGEADAPGLRLVLQTVHLQARIYKRRVQTPWVQRCTKLVTREAQTHVFKLLKNKNTRIYKGTHPNYRRRYLWHRGWRQ